MELRPQAHDIIRTWGFYTIVKMHFHFGIIPWKTVMISGHALAPDGTSIHKSLGNSPIAPQALLERYGADALRYWACGAALGSDTTVNEEVMRQGLRLSAKLWSAARFIAGHLAAGDARREPWLTDPAAAAGALHNQALLPTDRALLSWLQRTIMRVDESFRRYEYAVACEAIERFLWATLCDNYLEWVKSRLYDGDDHARLCARATLAVALLATLKMLAPVMPHITEAIYQQIFRSGAEAFRSIHASAWPQADEALIDAHAERVGDAFVTIGSAVRRFKTEHRTGLGTPLQQITISVADASLREALLYSQTDIKSLTRAAVVELATAITPELESIGTGLGIAITS
jgi:valyl-tRNA synthetase